MMNKLIERFKSFKWTNYVFFSLLFIFIIFMMWFMIGMSVSLSKGMSLFGGNYGEETSSAPGNMDYIMLSLSVVLNICLIAIFVYHLFFAKVETMPAQTKNIIKGKIVETKNNIDDDIDVNDNN